MPMTLALRWMECLLAWSMLLQTMEYLRMQKALSIDGLWAWQIQRADVPQAGLKTLLDRLFSDAGLRWHLWLRFPALLLLALGGSTLPLVLFLFVSHLLMLIRWRGAFNGGSDFMTLIVLTGLLAGALLVAIGEPDLGLRAALWYVSLQSITSYFMSGWVKLLRPEWRSGQAFAVFLNAAVYGPLDAGHLLSRPWVAQIASWAFILWECSAPLALLHPAIAGLFCTIALLFHFLVFWFFGLNRFFWAWLVSFPAILACSAQQIFA